MLIVYRIVGADGQMYTRDPGALILHRNYRSLTIVPKSENRIIVAAEFGTCIDVLMNTDGLNNDFPITCLQKISVSVLHLQMCQVLNDSEIFISVYGGHEILQLQHKAVMQVIKPSSHLESGESDDDAN